MDWLEPPELHRPLPTRLKTRIKHLYGAPAFTGAPVVVMISVYITQFYEKLGASLAYLSFFIALARSLDVLTDPMMSHITDGFRSKWGRRRPFMAVGSILYAALIIALFSPPNAMDGTAVALWFGGTYILFFLSDTLLSIPYNALGPELVDNYDDRSRLFFVSGLYEGIGVVTAVIFPFILIALYTDANPCDSTTCFNADGTGIGCLPSFSTGDFKSYDLYLEASTVPSADLEYFSSFDCTLDEYPWSGVQNYCTCVDDCATECEVRNERSAFTMGAAFFGIWVVISFGLCVYFVHEKQHAGRDTAVQRMPFAASVVTTFRNRLFTMLLPAWILDSMAMSVIGSMLVFYIRYVLQPEYQTLESNGIDCNRGIAIPGTSSESWKCDSTAVLGIMATALLVCAFLGMPIWLKVANRVGKRNAWVALSAINVFSNLLYLFLGPGDIIPAIVIGGINGLPFGAKFLSDSILADIIHYDELITGTRREATFTMFKSFLPKICAIPASALPIALLNAIGHVPSKDGRIMEQPTQIYYFCIFVAVIFPVCIGLCGLYFKMKFPLKTREQVDGISVGILDKSLDKPVIDPISGLEIPFMTFRSPLEPEVMQLLEQFRNDTHLNVMLDSGVDAGINSLLEAARLFVIYSILLVLFFILCLSATVPYLTGTVASVWPILSVIGIGVSLTILSFNLLRLRAILKLRQGPLRDTLTRNFIHRIITYWNAFDIVELAASGSIMESPHSCEELRPVAFVDSSKDDDDASANREVDSSK